MIVMLFGTASTMTDLGAFGTTIPPNHCGWSWKLHSLFVWWCCKYEGSTIIRCHLDKFKNLLCQLWHLAAERSELVHDCLRVCQGLSHRVGVVCVLSLHGLQNRKVSHHFQGWERSEGNKYLLDGFLNPKEVRCVESVLVKKHGCKEIGWVKFYENIEGAVVKSCHPKWPHSRDFMMQLNTAQLTWWKLLIYLLQMSRVLMLSCFRKLKMCPTQWEHLNVARWQNE